MLIRNILGQIKEYVAYEISFNGLQKKYPTCRFYRGVRVDRVTVFGKYNVIFANVSITGSIIGDHTFIQKNSAVNNAILGKFCSIAMGVTIGLGEHPTDHVSTHPAFYSLSQPIAKTFADRENFIPLKQTSIGHDVWIGQNAMIKDGVNVGTGSIIAAGAVVTKDVPEYAIAGGVPAKIIKYRFDEDVRKKIIATKWWDMPEEILQKKCHLFSDPVKFIESFSK